MVQLTISFVTNTSIFLGNMTYFPEGIFYSFRAENNKKICDGFALMLQISPPTMYNYTKCYISREFGEIDSVFLMTLIVSVNDISQLIKYNCWVNYIGVYDTSSNKH